MKDNYEVRLHKAMVEFHQSLFTADMKIRPEFVEYTDCPVCHSKRSNLAYTKDYFDYHRCSDCSMLYMNPRLNAQATMGFYNSDINKIYNEKKFDQKSVTTDIDDATNIENLVILDQFMRRNSLTNKKLLEVGCAKGVFLKAAKARGYEVFGLELNKENCRIANQLIGGGVSDIDLFEMKYPEGSFDIVYMRDVIEHIHNPSPFLKEVARILKSGGILYMETHNVDGLIHKVVKQKHTTIFGFEHPVHWSPTTIGLAMKDVGVELKQVKFQSIDFTWRAIIRYFLNPTFTTVFQWKVSGWKRFIFRCLNFIISKPVIRHLDARLTPKIANIMGAGSTMKVIGVKR